MVRRTIEEQILPYDPFGKNRMVYTISNQCEEDPTVYYEDGMKKIYLYTRGTEGNPSQELREMLKYMENSAEQNVTNQKLATIHQYVDKVKHSKEVGINYMKSWEHDRMIRDEGREEEVFNSVFENDYTVERGAEKLNIPKEEFAVKYQNWLKKEQVMNKRV